MLPDIYQRIKSRCPFTDRGDTVWSYAAFRQIHGRWPRLRSVPGFNDGLLRVKLHERDNQLRHRVTDKEFAKTYFAERLGETYVVPTIGVIHDENELHDWPFPDQCMIKPTDASGPYMPRHNGEPLDHKVLMSFFHQNHYRWTREKFYKHLQPKIIVEEFIDFNGSGLPPDLKLFCFFGKVKIIQWDRRDGPDGLVKRWYTPDWKPLNFVIRGPLMPVVKRPVNLSDLITAAEILAADFSSVRVDLYSDGSRILIGELTHVDGNATGPFFPDPSAELKLGRLFTDPGVTVEDLTAA
ncbi:ATP-grasp fold amidoligase family protein [Anderseniella sp. Alg231-50]|uniref:ATP-grasp fold amidoligase family protein n=1 Tax=Anderseniella sp. Alg231-50 TaxID=1922226 RepID=UPI000D557C3E